MSAKKEIKEKEKVETLNVEIDGKTLRNPNKDEGLSIRIDHEDKDLFVLEIESSDNIWTIDLENVDVLIETIAEIAGLKVKIEYT